MTQETTSLDKNVSPSLLAQKCRSMVFASMPQLNTYKKHTFLLAMKLIKSTK